MNESNPPDSVFGSAPTQDPFQAAKASAMKAAEELRSAAMQKATELRSAAEQRAQDLKSVAGQKAAEIKSGLSEKADEFKHYADDAVGHARESLGEARERCENLIADAEDLARTKPRQALLTAFGVGLVVGLLLRR